LPLLQKVGPSIDFDQVNTHVVDETMTHMSRQYVLPHMLTWHGRHMCVSTWSKSAILKVMSRNRKFVEIKWSKLQFTFILSSLYKIKFSTYSLLFKTDLIYKEKIYLFISSLYVMETSWYDNRSAHL
jgi:hypothetical protein